MEEFDINAETKRLESLYNHCQGLYHRVRFLCCSSETKDLKEPKKYYEKHLQEAKLAKEHCDVICQKRGPVLHHGFQTPRNR